MFDQFNKLRDEIIRQIKNGTPYSDIPDGLKMESKYANTAYQKFKFRNLDSSDIEREIKRSQNWIEDYQNWNKETQRLIEEDQRKIKEDQNWIKRFQTQIEEDQREIERFQRYIEEYQRQIKRFQMLFEEDQFNIYLNKWSIEALKSLL